MVKTFVDYKNAVKLQLARAPTWMDHAPVCCWFSYQCWFDAQDGQHVNGVTRAHVRRLRHSDDLQIALKTAVEEHLESCSFELHEAEQRKYPDEFWQWMNVSVQKAMHDLLPRLKRRYQNWKQCEIRRSARTAT